MRGGNFLAAFDQPVGGNAQRIRSGDNRAAAEGTDTELDHVCVALAHFDIGCFETEEIGNDLREGDLVSLPVRMRAHGHDHAAWDRT